MHANNTNKTPSPYTYMPRKLYTTQHHSHKLERQSIVFILYERNVVFLTTCCFRYLESILFLLLFQKYLFESHKQICLQNLKKKVLSKGMAPKFLCCNLITTGYAVASVWIFLALLTYFVQETFFLNIYQFILDRHRTFHQQIDRRTFRNGEKFV